MRSFASLLFSIALLTSALAQKPQAFLHGAGHSFFLHIGNVDAGHAVCPAPDGNLYVVGSEGTKLVILKISPEGKLFTADYLNVGDGLPPYFTSAITDSEGKLAIMGRRQFWNDSRSFLLRYDPILRKVLWAKISEQDLYSSGTILDVPAENAYWVALSTLSVEMVKINRSNGLIVPGSAFGYQLDSITVPVRIAHHQSGLYIGGYHLERSSPVQYKGKMPFLMRVTPSTGFVLWAKGSPVAPVSSAWGNLETKDIVIEDNAVYSLLGGFINFASRVYLQKRTLNGDLIWLREIYVPFISFSAKNLISIPDGFLLFGSRSASVIIKLNKEGEVLWAYQPLFSFGGDYQDNFYQATVLNGALYLTGKLFHLFISGFFLMKLDLSSDSIATLCDWLQKIEATSTLVADSGPRNPKILIAGEPLFFVNWPTDLPASFTPSDTMLCSTACADLRFTIDASTCEGGKPALFYTVCNAGSVAIEGNLPVWFYPDDPTQEPTAALGSAEVVLDPPLTPGECRKGKLTSLHRLNPEQTQRLYALINYDNSLPTPFSLTNLPVLGLPECNYTNNLTVSELNWPPAPKLDLGPDLILCENKAVDLDAGPNFIQYLWQDGSTAQTFTASEPGLYYWVETEDICGRKQRDSVFFSFSLLPDTRFGDTVICPGESLTYAVPGFATYEWAPAAGLDCTTCPQVVVKPQVSTTYTLVATDSLGCTLRDTFRVELYRSQPTLQCPASFSVSAPSGANTAIVHYAQPSFLTDCRCGGVALTLAQGLPSGAVFPIGLTTICFSAEDGCSSHTSCCFSVQVIASSEEEKPCDVKETPCVRFEILRILRDAKGSKTYHMRVINKCSAELESIAYALPQGLSAEAPVNGSVYTAPSGRQYVVRNPHLTPQRSIRFSRLGVGLSQGQAEVFVYTLPPQADPQYIHVLARLAPNTYVETHLNVFGCAIQQIQTPQEDSERLKERSQPSQAISTGDLIALFPNPVSDRLHIDATAWAGGSLSFQIPDAWSRVLWQETNVSTGKIHTVWIPADWPPGLYYLRATMPNGQFFLAKFVK